jgi:ketosteroid isomerase-like protein
MLEMNQETAQDANDSFYEAFQKLSLKNMEKIWKHDEDTICVHPGWELVIGWVAIRDSWVQIFQDTENITINANTLRLSKYGNLAIIISIEHLRATINGQKQKFGVLATNVYENSDGIWLLTHHHGSSISNYYLPNSEIS